LVWLHFVCQTALTSISSLGVRIFYRSITYVLFGNRQLQCKTKLTVVKNGYCAIDLPKIVPYPPQKKAPNFNIFLFARSKMSRLVTTKTPKLQSTIVRRYTMKECKITCIRLVMVTYLGILHKSVQMIWSRVNPLSHFDVLHVNICSVHHHFW
jgi:hypothetical protein